jgi:large subunit ribosomal protein L35
MGSRTPRKNEKKMPKLKTHTGAAKRFSKTGTGKIKRGQTKTRHILTSKSPKVKRKLGRTLLVSDGDYKKVAHDSLRLRHCVRRTFGLGLCRCVVGPEEWPPPDKKMFPGEKSGLHSE